MDILISSNLERLLYEAADRDGSLISSWMCQLKESGSYCIGEQRLEWLTHMFAAGYADDTTTAREIKRIYDRFHYVMDPHTAVASHALMSYRESTGDVTPAVIVSTASPYKFAEDVAAALQGTDTALPADAFDAAELLNRITGLPIPPQITQLRTLPILHTAICKKDEMERYLL